MSRRGNQTEKKTSEKCSPTPKKAVSKSLSTKAASKQDPQSFNNVQIETEILRNTFETPLTTKNTDFESLNPTTQQTPKEESKQYPQSLENAPNETGNLQNTFESAAALTDHATNHTDFEILNQQVKSMVETSDNKNPYGKGRARICKVCGKEGSWTVIMNHIEANHITGMSIPCDTCGKAFGSRDSMKSHRYATHRKGK